MGSTFPHIHMAKMGDRPDEDIYEVQLVSSGIHGVGEHDPRAVEQIKTEIGTVHVCKACLAVWLIRPQVVR